jgi:RHS repeat-associated protein
MPGRSLLGAEGYRYAFQGQEKDPETGKEAFELRLWDSRIGRWLTTDPYGQYNSPYLGMGNNPISRIDPDGGMDCPNPPCNEYESSTFNFLTGEYELDPIQLDGVDVFGIDKSHDSFSVNLRSDLGQFTRNTSMTLLAANAISTKDVFKIRFQPMDGLRAGGNVYNTYGLKASKIATAAKPVIRFGLRTAQGLSVAHDSYLLGTNQISQERFNFRTIGTGSTILTASLYSNPAGFLVGSTFFMAEMTHDSYHDMTDPDRNPNTIHSIGEARLNMGWAIENLEQGLSEGFDY